MSAPVRLGPSWVDKRFPTVLVRVGLRVAEQLVGGEGFEHGMTPKRGAPVATKKRA